MKSKNFTVIMVLVVAISLFLNGKSVKAEIPSGARISIQDKEADFITIARNLAQHNGGVGEQYQEIKEVFPKDIFSFEAESSKYELYSYLIPHTEALYKHYIAIAKDRSFAFVIKDIESYNDFISSLHLFLKDDKEFIQIAKGFLGTATHLNVPPMILWDMPVPVRGEEKSFRQWFRAHPEHKFHPPKVTKTDIGYSVEYYGWHEDGGTLQYEYFEIKDNGEVIKHLENYLDYMIGSYIQI